jgi:hypothetical protein
MTDLLWIWFLVRSLVPTFSPDLVPLVADESDVGKKDDADPDHHRGGRARAAVAPAIGHVDFFRTRESEHDFADWRSWRDVPFGGIGTPQNIIFIFYVLET